MKSFDEAKYLAESVRYDSHDTMTSRLADAVLLLIEEIEYLRGDKPRPKEQLDELKKACRRAAGLK